MLFYTKMQDKFCVKCLLTGIRGLTPGGRAAKMQRHPHRSGGAPQKGKRNRKEIEEEIKLKNEKVFAASLLFRLRA